MSNRVNIKFSGEKAKIDSQGRLSSTRVFNVQSTAVLSFTQVLALNGLPHWRQSHPTEDFMWVTDVDAAAGSDNFHWIVTVNYGPKDGSTSSNIPDDVSPPWESSYLNLRWYSSNGEEISLTNGYKDGDTYGAPSDPIVNSANVPYTNIKDWKRNLVVEFSIATKTVSLTDCYLFQNTLNLNAFTLLGIQIPAKKAKIVEITGSESNFYGESYDLLNYKIALSPEGHSVRVQDAGTVWGSSKSNWKPILDHDGVTEVTTDWPLDGAGIPLHYAAAATSVPQFNSFQTQYAADWKPLNLPEQREVG